MNWSQCGVPIKIALQTSVFGLRFIGKSSSVREDAWGAAPRKTAEFRSESVECFSLNVSKCKPTACWLVYALSVQKLLIRATKGLFTKSMLCFWGNWLTCLMRLFSKKKTRLVVTVWMILTIFRTKCLKGRCGLALGTRASSSVSITYFVVCGKIIIDMIFPSLEGRHSTPLWTWDFISFRMSP